MMRSHNPNPYNAPEPGDPGYEPAYRAVYGDRLWEKYGKHAKPDDR